MKCVIISRRTICASFWPLQMKVTLWAMAACGAAVKRTKNVGLCLCHLSEGIRDGVCVCY